jgi:ribosomal protein S18 acetylase RimI-like enzyme
MAAFEDRAGSLGIATMRLSVRTDNRPARRLFERCGWRALPAAEDAQELEYVKELI